MACGQSQYTSWLSAGLGLKHLKLELEDFMTQQIEECHTDLIQNVAMSMGLSSDADLDYTGQTLIHNAIKGTFKLTVFDCQIHSTNDIKICISNKCPNAACHTLLNGIAKLHRQNRPILNNTNMNPTQWQCDPLEFAKCFLKFSGNQHIRSIKEVDCAGILSIMLNLLPIANTLNISDRDIKSENNVLSKVLAY